MLLILGCQWIETLNRLQLCTRALHAYIGSVTPKGNIAREESKSFFSGKMRRGQLRAYIFRACVDPICNDRMALMSFSLREVKSIRGTGEMAQPNYSIDRRCEFRATSQQRVIVTNLTDTHYSFLAELINSSPCGLGLKTCLPLETETFVSVEWDETLVLGQIAFCYRSGNKYHAGLKMEYLIYDRTTPKPPA